MTDGAPDIALRDVQRAATYDAHRIMKSRASTARLCNIPTEFPDNHVSQLTAKLDNVDLPALLFALLKKPAVQEHKL